MNQFQPKTHKHVGTAVLSSILNECTYPQHICAYSVQTAPHFSALLLEQPPNTSNSLEHTENRTTQRHDRVSVPSLNTNFHTLFHFVSKRPFILQSTTTPILYVFKSIITANRAWSLFLHSIASLHTLARCPVAHGLFSSRGTILPLP